MKKFNSLFEKNSAADLKPKKDDDKETTDMKPRSKGEEDFKDGHKIDKKDHPVAGEDQFKGGTSHEGEHKGFEKKGQEIQKTYSQFRKMGGHGKSSYRRADKTAGDKAMPVLRKEDLDLSIEEELQSIKWTVKPPPGTKHVHPKSKWPGMKTDDIKNSWPSGKVGVRIKEDYELDETFTAGKLKLASGEVVTVNEKTAKLLNGTLQKLSGSNKNRMEQEAKKDQKSFNNMVTFAKSA